MIKSLEDFNVYNIAIKVGEKVGDVLKKIREFIVQLLSSTHPRLRFAKSSLSSKKRGDRSNKVRSGVSWKAA